MCSGIRTAWRTSRTRVTCSSSTCAPLASEARADDFVRKVKVKDHKVKVKAVDGKAKIKHKANGKQKIKVKGPNGDLAADLAYSAAGGRESDCSK